MERPTSNLFEGYRSLGHVTGPKPFIIRYGKTSEDTRFITILGKTFHSYTNKLILVDASFAHELDIESVTADHKLVYSCAGNSIFAWAAFKRLAFKFNGHQHEVHTLLKLTPKSMLSVDEASTVLIWSTEDRSK